LNLWECETGAIELKSYPTSVALPIADICNARCTFCSSWLEGTKLLQPEQLKPYLEVLPYARIIGIQGHGEPLANPNIEEILEGISAVVDPRASGYIITNGVFLARHLDALLASRITTFNISLNSVTPETHDVVMGLGPDVLPGILDSIRRLIQVRDESRPELQITISMVLTADNIQEAARFVELGNELRVKTIYLRPLMPVVIPEVVTYETLNYHRQSPIFHREFDFHANAAKEAIARSKVGVEAQPQTWATDAIDAKARRRYTDDPPAYVTREEASRNKPLRDWYKLVRNERGDGKFLYEIDDLEQDPYNRTTPFLCNFVYSQLITTKLTFEIFPCCYMTHVPGHEPLILSVDKPFMSYWNSDAMMNLRRRLRHGPLFQACATCPMQG
jgi:wyosine [tRNA(Phe)-imidazoG37] synthetase (radical SAM superfamily)